MSNMYKGEFLSILQQETQTLKNKILQLNIGDSYYKMIYILGKAPPKCRAKKFNKKDNVFTYGTLLTYYTITIQSGLISNIKEAKQFENEFKEIKAKFL